MQKAPLEVWGGVECTVNRVNDTYFDQMKSNGHERRIEDLDRFKGIGLHTLRAPFIWERIAPNGVKNADWSWADERLAYMKKLGIRPIAGFVHHGSGPRDTNLLDPEFGIKLSEFAAAFAQRYPWVEDYTPINEAFTTARFSALYGVWYPHKKSYFDCFTALINECKGTVLSMKEIRKINPRARLIQTDDLGKASSTPLLQYQVEFENERRFVGWDLLCGRIKPGHSMWDFILSQGIQAEQLMWFVENPCPPDIIGVNHYLLSNRFFDERTELYPSWSHGFNGKHHYADIESVRLSDAQFIPPKTIFKEAWERYHIPLAITEVHLDAPREDQVRWFMEVWNACQELRSEGADIRAVTAWGLLGHFDWHCLVSRCEGYYESGVYDLRAPEPRPTALASVLHSLSQTGNYEHPVLDGHGWWRRPSRIRHPEQVPFPIPGSHDSYQKFSPRARPLLITGARGTLGQAFARICELRAIPYRLLSRDQMDIADSKSIEKTLADLNPWAIINAAGYVRVDQAEKEKERCFRENSVGPTQLASAAAKSDIRFLNFSSDLVFDGKSSQPYLERSQTMPLNVYGESKAESEKRVLEVNPQALIIRTSAFFGPWDDYNFITVLLRALQQGQVFHAADDLKVSPTYVPDLVHTALNLLLDGETGIWHLANSGAVTWADFAIEAAKLAKLDPTQIQPSKAPELGWVASRPAYSVLGSERGTLLPNLDQALNRYFEDTQWRLSS